MLNGLLSEAKAKGGSWVAFAASVALIVLLFAFLAVTAAGNAGALWAANNVYNKEARGANKAEVEPVSTRAPSTPVSSDSAVPKKLTATSNEPAAAAQAGVVAKTVAKGNDATDGADTVEEQAAAKAAEKPASYVWTCAKDYGGIAPEDGSLSEWAPHYYIAYSYGPYGEAILQLESGDVVTVNGNEVTVQGAVEMSESCSYQEVMSAVGWDATVFQTCIPNSNQNRFVYARSACSTEQAAQEARRWGGVGAEVQTSTPRQEAPMEPQTIAGPWVQPGPQMGSGPQPNTCPEQPEASGRGFVGQRSNSPGGAFQK